MAAAAAGPQNTGGPLPDQFSDEGTDFVQNVQKAETHLLRRLPHGGKMRFRRLVDVRLCISRPFCFFFFNRIDNSFNTAKELRGQKRRTDSRVLLHKRMN